MYMAKYICCKMKLNLSSSLDILAGPILTYVRFSMGLLFKNNTFYINKKYFYHMKYLSNLGIEEL